MRDNESLNGREVWTEETCEVSAFECIAREGIRVQNYGVGRRVYHIGENLVGEIRCCRAERQEGD